MRISPTTLFAESERDWSGYEESQRQESSNSRWRRGSEKREVDAWRQVNTVGAMKIIPRASTLLTLPRAPLRLDFLVTYMDSGFGISRAYAKPAKPLNSFSSPGSGGRGPPKTGIGDRRQDQSFKISLYRAGSGVFGHPCADK